MSEFCGDNRFEIINKVKKRLLENTNIEQSPKELEVLDNLLFRLWQCGYFDYIEIFEKNEVTFNEWYKKSDCELTGVSIGIARCIYQTGANEMLKELKQKFVDTNNGWNDLVNSWVADYRELEKENEQLVKRICELQSDLSRERNLNEKMRRCSNCVHRFVIHFSQEGTCQRPNCKNYSDWCFDGQFLEIEKEQEVKE